MAIAVAFPILKPIGVPVTATPAVVALHRTVDGLRRGDVMILGIDYGPSTAPELTPMAKAILRHAQSREVGVVMVSLIADAPGIGNELLSWAEEELGMEDGQDVAYLGYKAGTTAVILTMGESIAAAFPTDYASHPTADLPLMAGVGSLHEVDLVIGLEATGVMDLWIQYAGDQMGVPVGGGVTAVSAPEYLIFLQSGQIVGLLGGMLGGAEYEMLVKAPGKATLGMDAQSLGHFVIVAFLVLGNLGFLLGGRRGGGARLDSLQEEGGA